MAAHETLQDVYADEIKDLWSANDQMSKVLKVMSDKASDPKLKQALEKSLTGIKKHTETLKTLLTDIDEEPEAEHCKGMEGLVKEAQSTSRRKRPRTEPCETS